jgi:hypothetical protein
MKLLTITLFAVLALLSCKKEPQLSPDIIGDWHSTDHVWQLPIRDRIGDGANLSFRETKESGNRYLTFTAGDSTYKFQIIRTAPQDLYMRYVKADSALHFIRWFPPTNKD